MTRCVCVRVRVRVRVCVCVCARGYLCVERKRGIFYVILHVRFVYRLPHTCIPRAPIQTHTQVAAQMSKQILVAYMEQPVNVCVCVCVFSFLSLSLSFALSLSRSLALSLSLFLSLSIYPSLSLSTLSLSLAKTVFGN